MDSPADSNCNDIHTDSASDIVIKPKPQYRVLLNLSKLPRQDT